MEGWLKTRNFSLLISGLFWKPAPLSARLSLFLLHPTPTPPNIRRNSMELFSTKHSHLSRRLLSDLLTRTTNTHNKYIKHYNLWKVRGPLRFVTFWIIVLRHPIYFLNHVSFEVLTFHSFACATPSPSPPLPLPFIFLAFLTPVLCRSFCQSSPFFIVIKFIWEIACELNDQCLFFFFPIAWQFRIWSLSFCHPRNFFFFFFLMFPPLWAFSPDFFFSLNNYDYTRP